MAPFAPVLDRRSQASPITRFLTAARESRPQALLDQLLIQAAFESRPVILGWALPRESGSL